MSRRRSASSNAAHASGAGGGSVVVVVDVDVDVDVESAARDGRADGGRAAAVAAGSLLVAGSASVVGTGRVGCGAARSALHAAASTTTTPAATVSQVGPRPRSRTAP
jgi:hypothetical protein